MSRACFLSGAGSAIVRRERRLGSRKCAITLRDSERNYPRTIFSSCREGEAPITLIVQCLSAYLAVRICCRQNTPGVFIRHAPFASNLRREVDRLFDASIWFRSDCRSEGRRSTSSPSGRPSPGSLSPRSTWLNTTTPMQSTPTCPGWMRRTSRSRCPMAHNSRTNHRARRWVTDFAVVDGFECHNAEGSIIS